jgi:thioredoxin-related protein
MKNKFSILLVLLIVSFEAIAQNPPATAESIVNTAVKKAGSEKKNVLLIFHASWCGWCHKMDASLSDPSCKAFFDKYYVIEHLVVLESKDKLALENPGGMDYLKKYSGDPEGLPYWVILDKSGNLLADSRIDKANPKGTNSGCPASEKEVNYFIDVLKSSSKLSNDQLKVIAKRFRLNEAK